MQFFSHIKNNWKSGLTVSLVSIPQQLSNNRDDINCNDYLLFW